MNSYQRYGRNSSEKWLFVTLEMVQARSPLGRLDSGRLRVDSHYVDSFIFTGVSVGHTGPLLCRFLDGREFALISPIHHLAVPTLRKAIW